MRHCIAALFVSAGCLASCATDTLYHHYEATGENGWERTDTLCFHLPHLPGHRHVGLEIGIRHRSNYPYKDLWLALSRPLSPHLPADTFHLYLADSTGQWSGSGIAGFAYQYELPLLPYALNDNDTVLHITHLMRKECLEGICDVGVRLSALPSGINAQKDEQQDGKPPER